MNGPITSSDIETVIKKLPTNKSLGPDSFIGEFYEKFGEELIYPSFLNSPKKLQRNTPKLIPCGHHHPDMKTRQRYHKKRKLWANISDKHRCKSPQQNTSKPNSVIY